MSVQSIIDSYDLGENGVFTAEDVQNIVDDVRAVERSSFMKRKSFLAACMLVVVVATVDRFISRNYDAVTLLPRNLDDHSSRRLQSESFTDWVQCEGVATVPSNFFTGEGDDTIYICKPTKSSYGCGDDTEKPTMVPTTANPTVAPTLKVTTLAPVTSVPTVAPTTSVPTAAPTPTDEPTTGPTSSSVSTKAPTKSSTDDPTTGPTPTFTFVSTKAPSESTKAPSQSSKSPTASTKSPTVSPVCEDDQTFTFDTPFGLKDCAWVASSPIAQLGYCPDTDVKNKCVKTCDNCVKSNPPTVSPTNSPTDTQTNSPTVSSSTAPSSSPTSKPTATVTTSLPTKIPTGLPTGSPTRKGTGSPTSKPTLIPTATQTEDECWNALGLDYAGDPKHDCEWLARDQFRVDLLCSKREFVREACPVTCGICCEDNPTYTFSTPFGTQDCAWVASSPIAQLGYCSNTDIKTYCSKACSNCREYKSMVPSTFIKSNLTAAPTSRLDDD